jgi:hypothetical protein
MYVYFFSASKPIVETLLNPINTYLKKIARFKLEMPALLVYKKEEVELILLASKYRTVCNRSYSYSGDPARRNDINTMEKHFPWLRSRLLDNAGIVQPITTPVHPPTSSPIHYCLIVLQFSVMYYYVLVTALLSRPQMETKIIINKPNCSLIKWHNRYISNLEKHAASFQVKF